MGLIDAVYVLEKFGLLVQPIGSGIVRKQSVKPGCRINKGQKDNTTIRMKLLKDILYGVRIEEVKGNTNIAVENISFDSREINNMSLFVAIKGHSNNGHDFISFAEKTVFVL